MTSPPSSQLEILSMGNLLPLLIYFEDNIKIFNFPVSFKSEQNRLDILINNAGVMRCPRMVTKEGIELQLGTNHMGHFLLTNLLLDHLKVIILHY